MTAAPPQPPEKPHRIPAQAVFFPAAISHALVFAPLTVLANTGHADLFPALAGAGHAREMLGGFALALVAGYTLGPLSGRAATGLLTLWLAARLTTLAGLPPGWTAAATAVFGLVLAARAVPRFLPARRWRNRLLPPLLAAVGLLPGLWGLHQAFGGGGPYVGAAGVLLLGMLMAFIGGRLIAPAAAGEFYNRGDDLANRVQPRLEAATLLTLPPAVALLLAEQPRLGGPLAVAAGACTLARCLRWRLWACPGRYDLHGLGLGYGWLAAGLMIIGAALAAGVYQPALAHLVTMGALGMLSTGVIARWHGSRHGHTLPGRGFVMLTVTAFAAAALLRVLVVAWPEQTPALLWAGAVAWSGGYLATGVVLARGKPFRQQVARYR